MRAPGFLAVSACCALPFMALGVAPLSFYFGNRNEIEFGVGEVALSAGLMVLLWTLLNLIFFVTLRHAPKPQQVYVGVLVGLSAAVWVQSQLFAWDFGPLDGGGIDWSRWTVHMCVEGVMWILVVSLVGWAFVQGGKKLRVSVLQAVFVAGSLSIVAAYATAPEKHGSEPSDHAKLFEFHPERNVLVIILDTFQSSYFDYIHRQHPLDTHFLDGFVFYENVISGFPSTRPNIPYLLTGTPYLNQVPFREFAAEAQGRYDLREQYAEAGYDVAAPGLPQQIQAALEAQGYRDTIPAWSLFVDYGVFRVVPTALKGRVYGEGDWFISRMLRSEYPPGQHGADLRVLELLERNAGLASTAAGSFKLLHFHIPHFPLRVNETLQYDDTLEGVDGYVKQARGALELLRRMLAVIQRLGIYDQTEIVVLSDHGKPSLPSVHPDDRDAQPSGRVPERVRSGALALLLHKPVSMRGALARSKAALTLGDLPCLLGRDADGLDCRPFQAAMQGGQRTRSFYFYDWNHKYWNREYLPPMLEYLVNGHAWDPQAWSEGGHRYEAGRTVVLNPKGRYEVGTSIDFSAEGRSSEFILDGWSGQGPAHRWSVGAEAALRLVLEGEMPERAVLRFRGSAYRARGRIEHQVVRVVVNSEEIAQWELRGEAWHDADLRRDLAGDGVLDIVLRISDPAAPCDFGYSNDCRKLGIAAKELVIESR
jgi:hypothetical protein